MSIFLPTRRPFWGPSWTRNSLWTAARAVPSLDLRFADNKSLVDATTGQNLVTFTRASSGTYVDSQGVIRTATTNLCLQSENFTTTWTNFLSTDAANTAIAPNGTLTADTLIPDSGATTGLIRQDFSGAIFTDNASISFSIYVKAAGLTSFNIQFFNKANTFYGTQTINASTGGLSGSGTIASTAVTNVGDGWYRVSMTGISAGSGATGPNIRLVVTSTGDGTSGIYLWGAQLEQSSTVGEYIPTTSTINSAPRFDHNPTTGESLGLLVEEQRTNLCLQSEAFGTAWTTVSASVSANTTTAPDGTLTADTITASSSTAGRVQQTITFTGDGDKAISVWFKAGTAPASALKIDDSTAGFVNRLSITVTWTAGVASAVASFGILQGIDAFPNGWYRIRGLAVGVVAANTNRYRIEIDTTNGTGTVIAWGAQAENGAFSTSYIPTTTAAATRSADVASITGSNFSSWYRQDEGTVFSSAARATTPSSTVWFATASDGTSNNRMQYGYGDTAGNYAILVSNSVVGQAYPSVSTLSRTGAFAYGSTGAVAYNGSSASQFALSSLPVVNQLSIGSFVAAGSGFLNGTIRRLTYWPQRLPNTTLQQITQ